MAARPPRVLPLFIVLFACAEPEPPPAPQPAPQAEASHELRPIKRNPPPQQLQPLEPLRPVSPELAKQLAELSRQNAVPNTEVPDTLRQVLESNCPQLTSFAYEVVGEAANQLADNSKAALAVQVVVGVGKIVVQNEQETICEFMTDAQ
jgi:hypothetical protein